MVLPVGQLVNWSTGQGLGRLPIAGPWRPAPSVIHNQSPPLIPTNTDSNDEASTLPMAPTSARTVGLTKLQAKLPLYFKLKDGAGSILCAAFVLMDAPVYSTMIDKAPIKTASKA